MCTQTEPGPRIGVTFFSNAFFLYMPERTRTDTVCQKWHSDSRGATGIAGSRLFLHIDEAFIKQK